jgi:hypothetical protein
MKIPLITEQKAVPLDDNTIKQQEGVGVINGVDNTKSVQDNQKSLSNPEWKNLWFDSQKDKAMADYMKEKWFSFDDYKNAKNQVIEIDNRVSEESEDRSFFQKLHITPMTDEDIRSSDEFFSKETFLNQWEWFTKNVLGWVSNIVTWLADLWIKAVSWTAWYSKDLVTWEKSLEDIKNDLVDAWTKTKEVWGLLVDYYKNTYWTKEGFKKWLMENPTWMIWDVLTVVSAWAWGASKVNVLQKTLLKTQLGAYSTAITSAKTVWERAVVLNNMIRITEKIVNKTWKIKSLSEWINIANKYNPYIAWPRIVLNATSKVAKGGAWVVWKSAWFVGNTKLIASALKLTPSQMAKTNAMLDTFVDWKRVSWNFTKWLTDKWIIRDVNVVAKWRSWVLDKLREFNTKAYDTLNEAIAWVKWKLTNENIPKALRALEKQFDWVEWLEWELKIVSDLMKKYNKGWLTLAETQKVKRLMDNNLSLYKASWLAKEWATKSWLVNIRKGLREFIEETWEKNWVNNIRALSSDVRVSRSIWDSLEGRITSQWVNNIISLSDSLIWWSGLAFWASIPMVAWTLLFKHIVMSSNFLLGTAKFWTGVMKIAEKVKNNIPLVPTERMVMNNFLAKYVKDRWVAIKTDIKKSLQSQMKKEASIKKGWIKYERADTGLNVESKLNELDFFKKQWDVVKDVFKDWGWTYIVWKRTKISEWEPYVVVSMYPNRWSAWLSKSKFTKKTIWEFITKNKDVLLKDNHSLGFYVDDAGKVHIDVSVIMPKTKLAQAEKLGKKYDQISIWDNETFTEIPTWWTWKNVIKVTDDMIQADIDKIFASSTNKLAWEELIAWELGAEASAETNLQKKKIKWDKDDTTIEQKIIPKESSSSFVNAEGKYIWTQSQVDDMYEYYKKTYHGGENSKSVIIDSDNIKKLFTDYNPDKPELVHTASSKLASWFYRKALEENPSKKVVLTAWGWWSWKSEVLVDELMKTWDDVIIFDWTWKDYDKVMANVKLAREAWKEAEIQAVYIPYFMAKEFNEMRKRTVPLDILETTHQWMRETLLRIAEEWDVPLKLVSYRW